MEIALLSPQSIKIKNKQVVFIIDPQDIKGKQQADAVIVLEDSQKPERIEESRITVQGPGEYEISAVKINAVQNNKKTVFYLVVDAMMVLVAKSSAINEKDARDVDVAIINADTPVNQEVFAAFNARLGIFFGLHAKQSVTDFGKEVATATKYIITKDKLPAETGMLLLG